MVNKRLGKTHLFRKGKQFWFIEGNHHATIIKTILIKQKISKVIKKNIFFLKEWNIKHDFNITNFYHTDALVELNGIADVLLTYSPLVWYKFESN